MSIGINDDIEKIKALEDNILEQYNKNVELANKMKQETEKFAKQANTAIEDYNSNAEAKAEEFNTNVKEKTDEFNSNATEKETEISDIADSFDANVEEKTNTFNSNVETKTTEFNNNSNAKTEEFNNNSTEKINAFNSNAEEKIADYNKHVETLTSRIADLEEETEDLFNALNTEKASGTELYIEDAKPCKVINAGINGMYKQETTNGYQLLDLKDHTVNSNDIISTITKNKIKCTGSSTSVWANITTPSMTKFKLEANKTYTIVINKELSYNFCVKINKAIDIKILSGNVSTTFISESEITSLYFYIQKANLQDLSDVNITDLQIIICEGEYDSAKAFEPYTGAIASPNPDYTQKIEQVESVKLNINNKNLFNKNIGIVYSKHYSLENGELEDYASDWYQENYINAKPNTTYSISVDGNIAGWLRALEYDANKNFLVGHNFYKFTTDSRCRYLRLSAGKSKLEKLQLEIGEIITEYSEYDLFLSNIDLKGNKLCAVSNTIKDKLLIDKNGNVALQKNVITFLLNGTNPHEAKYWRADTIYDLGNGYSHFYLYSNYPGVYQNKSTEKFTYVIADKLVTGKNILNTECINNSAQLHIQILTSRLETNDAEGFKKWLANNNITVYAKSSAPELIDLGRLPELPKTFEGINNIWAETNLGNTEIEIEYVQDVKKLLEKQAEQQNARLDNIENLLSTTETSALLLDNMQTDLESEVK